MLPLPEETSSLNEDCDLVACAIRIAQMEYLERAGFDDPDKYYELFNGTRSLSLHYRGVETLKAKGLEFYLLKFDDPLNWKEIKTLQRILVSPFYVYRDQKSVLTLDYCFYITGRLTQGKKFFV
jgi:hypothetical protein